MELLESDSARPRQARYQAALRPDMKLRSDYTRLAAAVGVPTGELTASKGVKSRVHWNSSDHYPAVKLDEY